MAAARPIAPALLTGSSLIHASVMHRRSGFCSTSSSRCPLSKINGVHRHKLTDDVARSLAAIHGVVAASTETSLHARHRPDRGALDY